MNRELYKSFSEMMRMSTFQMILAVGGVYYDQLCKFSLDGKVSPFASIPDSFWWCIVTMTTVGYGDKFPITGLGQIVAVATMTMGIFFISMPLAIVGSCRIIMQSWVPPWLPIRKQNWVGHRV